MEVGSRLVWTIVILDKVICRGAENFRSRGQVTWTLIRPSHLQNYVDFEVSNNHPYSAVHHNDKPLVVRFLSQAPKAIECRQCQVKCWYHLILLLHMRKKYMYPDPNNHGEESAVDEIYNEILLYKTLLYFEPIPILRPRLPGNFIRSEIGSEGCAHKIDSSRARLQWNLARNSCDVKCFSIECQCRCLACIIASPGSHQFAIKYKKGSFLMLF